MGDLSVSGTCPREEHHAAGLRHWGSDGKFNLEPLYSTKLKGRLQFASNMGYMCEVSAHWVSSYFQSDPMRLPSSPEEAIAEGERASVWMRHRYPNMISWINESYSTGLDFWTYVGSLTSDFMKSTLVTLC